MATRICIVSTKGGRRKDDPDRQPRWVLADLGQLVLLVDGDVQPTLSSYYQTPRGLVEVLETAHTADSISVTGVGCDIVLSNDSEGRLADWILHTLDGRFRLKLILKRVDAYDVILIDTQALVADFLISSPFPRSSSRRAKSPVARSGYSNGSRAWRIWASLSATSMGSSTAWIVQPMREPRSRPCGPCLMALPAASGFRDRHPATVAYRRRQAPKSRCTAGSPPARGPTYPEGARAAVTSLSISDVVKRARL